MKGSKGKRGFWNIFFSDITEGGQTSFGFKETGGICSFELRVLSVLALAVTALCGFLTPSMLNMTALYVA